MKTWSVTATVYGGHYVGDFKAETGEQALQDAMADALDTLALERPTSIREQQLLRSAAAMLRVLQQRTRDTEVSERVGTASNIARLAEAREDADDARAFSPWEKIACRQAWRRYDSGNVPVAVVSQRDGRVYAMTGHGLSFVETVHASVAEAQVAADARLGGAR